MEDQPLIVGSIPDPKPTERRRLVVEDGKRWIWVEGGVRNIKTLEDAKRFILKAIPVGHVGPNISNPKTVIAIERQEWDAAPFETVAVLQGSWDDPPTPRDLPYPLFGEVVNTANRKYTYGVDEVISPEKEAQGLVGKYLDQAIEMMILGNTLPPGEISESTAADHKRIKDGILSAERNAERMKRDPVIQEALRPLDVLVLLVFNYPLGNREAEIIQRKNAESVRGCQAVVCPRNPTGDWPAVEKITIPLSRG